MLIVLKMAQFFLLAMENPIGGIVAGHRDLSQCANMYYAHECSHIP